ncbi:BrnT family toxin [Paracoccus sp. SSK6]|uniref:BrnT family toxin n=1 Tax=Paracoccus sp. SSK6 TaxID=3143131 RepID=UPI003219DE3B
MSEDDSVFEWDEAKRLKTIEKHGIDFTRATQVFEGPHLETEARSVDEVRRTAIGKIGDHVIAGIFTRRGNVIRIITARRARRNEREAFRSLYGGSDSADGRSD